jgi:hypothetical protein
MTTPKLLQVVGALLPLLMVAAGPANAPMSDVITLASPNEETGGQFAYAVAGGGDVNQDGSADVIVGAWRESDLAGRAYVFSGEDASLLFELASPNEVAGGFFGASVAGAGDTNQDGFADLVVGAFGEGGGQAYVFSGLDGTLLFELVSPNPEPNGEFGRDVAGAGDIDQDGFSDVIVGAHREDPGTSPDDSGRAYVFSGQDGSLLFELVSPHEEFWGNFGWSVAGSGDVDKDGIPDLIVGAWREEPSGRVFVFSGQDGSLLLDLVSPDARGGRFGFSVAGAGEVNGDGIPDLIVGAHFEADLEGRVYVFSGEDGRLLIQLESPNGEERGEFGRFVAGPGDIDRDGFDDVLVGAPEEAGNGPEGAGRAYVFSGQSGTLLLELVSPNEEFEGAFGYSVSGAGDVNQDGLPDVIVGAHAEESGTSPVGAGRAYVFLSTGQFRINSGGPNYTGIDGSVFVADRAYAPGSFGYVGGVARHFDQPIGGTDDDPLYQDVRLARQGDSDGIFSYRFDVSPGRYDVTLYLMAPALDGPGNVVMDVRAEEEVVFDDLDVTAEAGGAYQALVKTFAVDVTDGTLVLRFRAENKAAVVSAIAVAAPTEARGFDSRASAVKE